MTHPETMKAVVLTGHGGLDKLEWREDVPVPRPTAGEVLIRVGASAVNNTDVNTRTGWYSKAVRGDTGSAATEGYGGTSDADGAWSGALSFPRIQGADCCGEIVAVGDGVNPARIGERVLVRPMHRPTGAEPDALVTFGSERDGGFAEYTTVDDEHAVRIDSALTDIELASFPCAFSTAEGMIQRAGLGAERVLITGASGGVGSAAVQLAKRRGAHVTASTSPAKMDTLKTLGADAVMDRNDAIPKDTFDIVLDLRTLYLKDLTLIGSTRQDPRVFTNLVGYIEAGEIRPVVAETYPLQDLRAAQGAFLEKSHMGKIGIAVSN